MVNRAIKLNNGDNSLMIRSNLLFVIDLQNDINFSVLSISCCCCFLLFNRCILNIDVITLESVSKL